MRGKLVGFIRKAISARQPGPSRHGPSRGKFNLRDYMPSFSQRDHAFARRKGYRDAEDQWLSEAKAKLATHAEMERRKRAKLQTLLGMESDGVPMEDLIDVADRAGKLPAWSEAGPPQVRVPGDPNVLKVKVAGMVNWYIALVERLASRGLDFGMSEEDVPYANRGCLRDAIREREKLALRLEACGENIDIIHEQILQGLIHRVDRVEVVIPSNDPLIRQIQDHEEAMRSESGEDEDTGSTLTVVLEADARVPSKESVDSALDKNAQESEGDESEETVDSSEPDEFNPADDVDEASADGGATPEGEEPDDGEWDAGWSDPWN